jgi:hypothetical protein
MKSTISDNRQLFNIKTLVYGKTYEEMLEGETAIFAEDETTSIASALPFADMPKKFEIIHKMNGVLYTSFSTIEKDQILNQMEKDYTPEVVNIWKGTVDSCDCIEGVNLRINIDEQSLIQRDGLTWVHHDNIYAVSPEELACNCSCTGTKPVYANNVMTKLLAQKVNAANSPFYEAEIEDEDGNLITDVDTFIEDNLEVNTDDDADNDGQKLVLVIKGKKSPALQYRFFEINEVYPRGVRLHPGMVVNGKKNIAFTETQKLAYEIGAGYDLMSEEWNNMSNYTTLNHYTKYSDGLPNPNVTFQFENYKNYHTLTFEYMTRKVERNNGDRRFFLVLMGTTEDAVYADLKTMFIPV